MPQLSAFERPPISCNGFNRNLKPRTHGIEKHLVHRFTESLRNLISIPSENSSVFASQTPAARRTVDPDPKNRPSTYVYMYVCMHACMCGHESDFMDHRRGWRCRCWRRFFKPRGREAGLSWGLGLRCWTTLLSFRPKIGRRLCRYVGTQVHRYVGMCVCRYVRM